jgi:hypothetical protein
MTQFASVRLLSFVNHNAEPDPPQAGLGVTTCFHA